MTKIQNTSSEPHDDRWHYLESRDERHEANYIEWKYFNFTQKDLAGYVIYFVIDPERKTKHGGGRLLVRILQDGKSYGFVKKIDMDRIELDTVSASMRMGGSKIVEHDSYHYEISANLPDAAWDLTYKQHAPTIEAFENEHYTNFVHWEKFGWLIKMPRAEVTGKVKIGENIFQIDGLGYSDTNWGEMVPFFTHYEWGQYNEKNFSLVFSAIYTLGKMKSNYVYAILGERLVSFENAEFRVEHTEWREDETIGIKIPIKNIFTAKKGEYELKFTTKLLYHDNLGFKISPLLPKGVVSEQLVAYEGTVSQNGQILHTFQGKGFQEWSGKTWKNIPLSFS